MRTATVRAARLASDRNDPGFRSPSLPPIVGIRQAPTPNVLTKDNSGSTQEGRLRIEMECWDKAALLTAKLLKDKSSSAGPLTYKNPVSFAWLR